jgi:hypothetical protein
MSRTGKITPAIERAILKHAAAGKSTRWISKWLAKQKNVSISHVAVGNLIRQTRSDRADVAKATVRKHLSTKLPADLVVLDERVDFIVAELRKIEADLCALPPRSTRRLALFKPWRELCAEYRKSLAMKLHFCGADAADDGEKIESIAALLGLAFDAPKLDPLPSKGAS